MILFIFRSVPVMDDTLQKWVLWEYFDLGELIPEPISEPNGADSKVNLDII